MSINQLSGIVGIASLLASGAFAGPAAPPVAPPPVVTTTVNATTGATGAVGVAPTPGIPGAPYVSPGGATSTVGGATRDSFGNIQVQPVETIGMKEAQAQAKMNAAATGHENGLGATAYESASMSLDTGASVSGIRGTAFEARDALMADIKAKVATSVTAMASIEARAKEAGADVRARFEVAQREVKHRERQLNHGIDAALDSPANTWDDLRESLAVSYGVYAAAVAHAEAEASSGEASTYVKLDAGATADSILSSNVDQRESVKIDVASKIKAGSETVAALEKRSGELRTDAKEAFKGAVKEVHARQRDLEKSVARAADSAAESWPQARAAVAINYSLYAEAVAHTETLANAGSMGQATAMEN